MICKICSNHSNKIFTAKILKKYDISYYFCSNCNFLQTEEPYWLEEAYSSSIGIQDTGILKRNFLLSKRTAVIINFLFDKNYKCLDFAGGYGIFVRMMRDIGYDFYWSDLYSKNLLAKGFEFDKKDKIELITAFECFEHFLNPIDELVKMMEISKSILFSTRVFNNTPPEPKNWWYYNLNAGQHISLYSIKTLRFLAQKFNLNLYTNNKSYHLLTDKKTSNIKFNLLLKLSEVGLSNIVKLTMKSKTDSDFDMFSS